MITLKDVAVHAGVSIATASRVINGNRNVAEVSRKRVLEAINELGYYSNDIAKGLRQEHLSIIAVTLPSISNLFFAEMLQGIDDVTTVHGYHVLFNDTTGNDTLEQQYLRNIRSLGIAGSILFHLGPLGNDLLQLCDTEIPCMVITGTEQVPVRKIQFIHYDVKTLSQIALNYLSSFQLTDTWFFSPIYNGNIYLSEKTISSTPFKLHWLLTNDNPKDVKRMCLQHVSQGQKQAFITVNDFQSLGILNYLKDQKDPVRLVSFGDTALAQNMVPQVTSIGPSGYQLGVVTAMILLAKLNGQSCDEYKLLQLLKPTLIQRET